MAQAVLTLIPTYLQLVVDDTAGTTTFQWWNGTAWVDLQQITNSSGTQVITGSVVVSGAINSSMGPASFAGTTAGTVYWTMPFQGSGYKKVVVFLNAYENSTTTAQTITYPTAFADTPNIYNPGAVPGVTTTTAVLSLNPNTTSTYTGWLVVEGF